MSSIVVICQSDQAAALRKRLEADPAVVVFADSDSLKALERILSTHPKIVALGQTFVATARGAGLVARLKGDADLGGIDVRVLIEDEDRMPLVLSDRAASSEKALLETSRPLDRAGTRAALRYVMDRRPIIVNGERSHLIDLSVTGAQVLLPMRARPNEPVRVVFSDKGGKDDRGDKGGEPRFSGTIVWSVAVPSGGTIQYRAGVKLANPDTKWIEEYCVRFGGRPDLTFGAQ